MYSRRELDESIINTLYCYGTMQARSRHSFPGAGIFNAGFWRSRLSALRRRPSTADTTTTGPGSVFPLLDLPNEIVLIIAETLEDAKHLYYLLLTNRRLAYVLTPLLHKLAVQDKCSVSALHWAAWRGHADLVKLLIQQKGFDVNLQNPTYLNWTPLHWALCRRGRSHHVDRVVRLLLENGADVSIRDRWQGTVLHRAVEAQAGDALNLMLRNGARSVIDAREVERGYTALHMAVETCPKGTLWEPLLEMGADTSVRDIDGRTPLHVAVRNQNPMMVRALLDKGAGINDRDHRGQTPLYSAFRAPDSSVIKLLLDNGANVNLQCVEGKTPLHMAVKCNDRMILEMILQAGADVDIEDRYGATPISVLEKLIKSFEYSPKWKVLLRYRTIIKRYEDMVRLLKMYRAPETLPVL